MSQPFISIQVPSNRPQQLEIFLSALERTASDCKSFEVIFNLDVDDMIVSKYLDEQITHRPFSIKYIKTFTGGFYHSWKPINDMIPFTHPNAYFLIFLSDEFTFSTPGWDDILKRYVGYYPDNIFRLRASQFRYRNYNDLWECGFAPDSICFTTRKWVDIIEDWAPCFSSDAFQQCVAYYLYKSEPFSKEHYNRDIPVHDLSFTGEGASIGLTGEKAVERARGGLRAWFTLMSYKMQTEAFRRAMLLKANMVKEERYAGCSVKIIDNPKKRQIEIIDAESNKNLESLPYRLNKVSHLCMTQWRKLNYLYYAGGGRERRDGLRRLRFNITYYLSSRYDLLRRLHDRCNHYEGVLKSFAGRIKRKFI